LIGIVRVGRHDTSAENVGDTTPVAMRATKARTLPQANAANTVYARFRNPAGLAGRLLERRRRRPSHEDHRAHMSEVGSMVTVTPGPEMNGPASVSCATGT
jgi:hypothetical protein